MHFGQFRVNDSSSLDSIHPRHADIHKNDVRLRLAYQIHGGVPIRCLTDDGYIFFRLQQTRQTLAHGNIVICEYYSNHHFL